MRIKLDKHVVVIAVITACGLIIALWPGGTSHAFHRLEAIGAIRRSVRHQSFPRQPPLPAGPAERK